MSVLMVPPMDKKPWPTLGPQVCKFIEENLVFGPGDLRGEPAVLDEEKRGLIYRMYEVHPRKYPEAGRRRFRRVAISLRKGSAKTEFSAWLAACELHPEAPVRCVGWERNGTPIGGGVTDPYIPLVAFTEEQSEELAYGALMSILLESRLADDFDIGLARIIRRDGTGRAVALSTAPGARDGARTTFQVFDETHRLILPRQKQAHRTMLANLPKRKLADAWSLETTTAYSPGEGSVAEDTMDYARMVRDGATADSKLFFFHRQASEKHDLTTREGLRTAIREASGPVAEWSDVDGIADQWQDPTADVSFLERVWLNRPVRSSARAFGAEQWKTLTDPVGRPEPGRVITLGFDGARNRDSTALIGTDVERGYQFVLGLWERPPRVDEWEVPIGEIKAAVADAFETWDVWRMYADPPYWESTVDEWAGQYPDRVVAWYTNRWRQIAYAVRAFHGAIVNGEISHDGDEDLARHVGNATKKELALRDDEDKPLWCIQKERPDSPHKIDAAMAAVLSWEARGDAVAAGGLAIKKRSKYETQGVRVF
jgi:phage terminase large subunit-like protein